jgi:hypothetical protein
VDCELSWLNSRYWEPEVSDLSGVFVDSEEALEGVSTISQNAASKGVFLKLPAETPHDDTAFSVIVDSKFWGESIGTWRPRRANT